LISVTGVNYFCQSFSQVRASDLVLCDHSGAIVRGNHTVNKAAFVIHSAIHEGRPDAICAVHAHSMYGKTFSALGRKLLPITQDSCAFYDDHSLYNDFGGVVYTPEEGERLKSALGQSKAMILRNHGLLTVGSSVDEAIWWFISMERCCMSQLIAEAASTNGYQGLKLIDHEVALGTRSNVGDKQAGYFQFQPMFAQICKEQPDLLE
jgi:ribulose-5-phosphate 4-epimerase/fuculose-1-phosphate aldolase